MAATIQIHRWTGAGAGSGADVTSANVRFKQADNNTQDTNNPIPAVGTLGSNASVSCWVSTRLHCGATPPANAITNLRWWSDGTGPWTGTSFKVREADQGANAGYVVTPTTNLTEGAAGHLTQANHAGLTGVTEPSDGFAYTSGAPLSYGTGNAFNNTSANSDGLSAAGNPFIIGQIAVGSTASPGTLTTETITFQYDET